MVKAGSLTFESGGVSVGRYAVIDIETTGLSPAYHHRVLEVAIVLVDDEGNVVYEWDTLLNPQRDVGATHIHGLSAADVYDAPTFDQIAGEVACLLSGRVPVAHNLSFDASFLVAEFERLGVSVPLGPTAGLCTMRLAACYLRSGPRTLEACCHSIGCRVDSAHAALEDARATARLLSHYVGADDDFLSAWADVICAAQNASWPSVPAASAACVSRQQCAAAVPEHFLGCLASRTPRSEAHPEANSYLALLDRALLDRQLSCHEEDELVSAATGMGLCFEEALALHRMYLAALCRLALGDGVVTRAERAELKLVANTLGLTAEDVDTALSDDAAGETPGCHVGLFDLKPGDAVVFTGDAPGTNRADIEYQARSLGLRVTGSVSGRTRLVVAADTDTISSKARKARDLGIPIVDYAAYQGMLDSLIS